MLGIQACEGPDCTPHLQSAPHLPRGVALAGRAPVTINASAALLPLPQLAAAEALFAHAPAPAAVAVLGASAPAPARSALAPAQGALARAGRSLLQRRARSGDALLVPQVHHSRRLADNTPLAQGGVVPGGQSADWAPPAPVPGQVTNPKAVKNAAIDGTLDGVVQSVAVAKAGIDAVVHGAVSHALNAKQARARPAPH